MWEYAAAALFVVAVMAATFLIEPIFPLGDWRWGVVLMAATLAGLWAQKRGERRRRMALAVSSDGRQLARDLQRLKKRHRDRADHLYAAYRSLPDESKQFPHAAEYGYWMYLMTHFPDRCPEYAKANPGADDRTFEGWQAYAVSDPLPPTWWERTRALLGRTFIWR